MPTRRSPRRAALVVAAALAAPAPAAAELPPGREIVRSGARIPGLGRVGEFWGHPLAIDDAGRLVAFAMLSDGSAAVLRSAGGQPQVVWRQSAAGGDDPVTGYAVSSPDGRRVVTLGAFGPADGGYVAARVFDLTDGARVILQAGDELSDGSRITGVRDVRAVADGGAILLEARVAIGGATADAIVVDDAGGARLVAASGDPAPAHLRFAYVLPTGLRTDGTAIVSGCRAADWAECGVYVADGTTVEPLLVSGDLDADGGVVEDAFGIDVAPNGEVLLQSFGPAGGGHARTAGADLLPVAGEIALADGPFRAATGRLNERGDVVWSGSVGNPTGYFFRRHLAVVLVSADGTTRRLPQPAAGAGVNARGQVAAVVYPTATQPEVVRWSGGDPVSVLSTRTATADGAELWAAGIGAVCLADDGRIAFLARTLGGASGWVCDDGQAQSLLGSLQTDRRVYNLGAQCAFAGDQLIGRSDEGVVRLDGRRVIPVISAGDVLPDGTVVDDIFEIAANDRGTVVALESSQLRLVRQRRGGPVELVRLDSDGAPAPRVQSVGLAADDTIVAVVSREAGSPALVAHRDGVTTALDTADTLGAGHYSYDLLVSGMWAVLATTDPADQSLHLTVYDLATGVGRPILAPAERPDPALVPYPASLTPSGELLLVAYDEPAAAAAVEHWIWRDGAVEVLGGDGELGDAGRPFALASSGALLLDASTGVNRALTRVSATGPAATARCPGAASTATTQDDDGCQVAPGSNITAWPFVLAALLWSAARQRRGAAAARRRRSRGARTERR